MACTSGLASAENTAVPMKIRFPEGSHTIGSRKISTCVTSMLSSAQPVRQDARQKRIVIDAEFSGTQIPVPSGPRIKLDLLKQWSGGGESRFSPPPTALGR